MPIAAALDSRRVRIRGFAADKRDDFHFRAVVEHRLLVRIALDDGAINFHGDQARRCRDPAAMSGPIADRRSRRSPFNKMRIIALSITIDSVGTLRYRCLIFRSTSSARGETWTVFYPL
jgi:hypothetical protein